jgi:hypothetical protein
LLVVALLLGSAAIVLLWPLGNDYRARWYGEATDAAHVLLFALLTWAIAVYGWSGQRFKAALLAAGVAITAEAVQPLIGRSASWRDLAYGMLGIAIALVWLSPGSRWLRALAILALALWPAIQTGPLLVDALWAWRSFPVLSRFDSPFEARRWYFQQARLVSAESGRAVLELDASENGSGAILFPVVRDWSDYKTLEIDFSFEGPPMTFLISVRDGKKLPPELPRYDLWRRYEPGEQRVRIDLDELARGGAFPPIELHRVQSLHLVAYSGQQHRVVLKRIELTGRKTAASGQ